MASFYFHQKWCVIFWKIFLGCARHQLLREGRVLSANACALCSWLENALKMKKAPCTQQGTEQEYPLCVCPTHHFQTQRAALSLPCNPTRGDASDGMRKRRQGMFKKAFPQCCEAPEALQQRRTPGRASHGLPEYPMGCAWVLAQDSPSQRVKRPSPSQCSCFCTLESPTLPKAQANATKHQ